MKLHLSSLVFAPFGTFIMMFIGAGFISGSIVHFGEGITTWDVSVLILGVILFVIGSYLQETVYENRDVQKEGLFSFLFFSLILSIGVGMASGGTQHFIDTPSYSAKLIPLGLAIGSIAFVLRNKIALNTKQWGVLLCINVIAIPVLWCALLKFDEILPDSLRVGHGSHGHHGQQEEVLQIDSHQGSTVIEDEDHIHDDSHAH